MIELATAVYIEVMEVAPPQGGDRALRLVPPHCEPGLLQFNQGVSPDRRDDHASHALFSESPDALIAASVVMSRRLQD